MLFGVPDEITDVTRVSGMVRKQRFIFRVTSFDYRKVFGHYRECSGSDKWVPEVHREGATLPGEAKGLMGGAPALSGLVGQPKRALCAIQRKIKEKEKEKKGRWERREGLHFPILVGLGFEEGSSSLGGAALGDP